MKPPIKPADFWGVIAVFALFAGYMILNKPEPHDKVEIVDRHGKIARAWNDTTKHYY